MAENNKISDIIATALENIKNVLDADTVIGTPIATDNGTTIIPVSKISMGLATGGLDLPNKEKEKEKPADPKAKFGGGTGTGISVSPLAFLVIKPDGNVEMLSVGATSAQGDTVNQIANLIDRSPEIVAKFKEVFKKK